MACVASTSWADFFVVNIFGSGSKISRYDENTGAFLGKLDNGGETWGGIGVGPDNRLYATGNVFGCGEMYRSTGPGVGYVVGAPPGPPDHGWTSPQDAAFGPDGNFYVTSIFNSGYPSSVTGVLKYSTTGTYLGQFTNTAGTFTTFGPTGDLFVNTSLSSAGNVERFHAGDGAPLGNFVSVGDGGLGTASGITFGPDGNFYVGDSTNNRVLRYNGSTGAFVDVFVTAGSGGLNSLGDLAFGPDGNLYVGNRLSVLRYNGATGAFMNTFVSSNATERLWAQYMTFGTVPEPATIGAIVSGIGALMMRRRR